MLEAFRNKNISPENAVTRIRMWLGNSRKVAMKQFGPSGRFNEIIEEAYTSGNPVKLYEDGTSSFNLNQQTEAELTQQEADRKAAEQEQAQQQQEDQQKAQADKERDDFALTGSTQAADVAMAGGQSDLLGTQPNKNQAPATSTSYDQWIQEWAYYLGEDLHPNQRQDIREGIAYAKEQNKTPVYLVQRKTGGGRYVFQYYDLKGDRLTSRKDSISAGKIARQKDGYNIANFMLVVDEDWTPPILQTVAQSQQPAPQTIGKYTLDPISDKAFVVKGSTPMEKHNFNANGLEGKWHRNSSAWMFPESRREEVISLLLDLGKPAKETASLHLSNS